uniref:Protein phosphatase inhibitor 2 n=1 Tax=Tanacetum cinerariifolium TaxID=118510 RepID=A0A6L2MDS1_TANCI|nr:protein phosphatase inhibitor 2 [Tanacetum cinerariifolium]
MNMSHLAVRGVGQIRNKHRDLYIADKSYAGSNRLINLITLLVFANHTEESKDCSDLLFPSKSSVFCVMKHEATNFRPRKDIRSVWAVAGLAIALWMIWYYEHIIIEGLNDWICTSTISCVCRWDNITRQYQTMKFKQLENTQLQPTSVEMKNNFFRAIAQESYVRTALGAIEQPIEVGMFASFKDHRRAHYDEFHQVRELRRKVSLHESSNDDDEDKLNEESDTPSSLAVSVEDIDITVKAQNGQGLNLDGIRAQKVEPLMIS